MILFNLNHYNTDYVPVSASSLHNFVYGHYFTKQNIIPWVWYIKKAGKVLYGQYTCIRDFCQGRVAFILEKRFLSFVFHEGWWWTRYRLPGSIILASPVLSHDKAENPKLSILAIRWDNAKMSQNTPLCCVPSMPIICSIERRMIIMSAHIVSMYQ